MEVKLSAIFGSKVFRELTSRNSVTENDIIEHNNNEAKRRTVSENAVSGFNNDEQSSPRRYLLNRFVHSTHRVHIPL